MNIVVKYILFFFFYSAVGWFFESLYCSVRPRKWVNRGFLTGPLCPIYGTGAVVLAVCLSPIKNLPQTVDIFGFAFPVSVPLVFVAGMVLCDIVEFITSVIMEKLFHARWWDYSGKKFNIQGRICLTHTFYWGIAAVAFMYLVHPVTEKLVKNIPGSVGWVLLGAILVVFVFDLINAVRSAMDVKAFMDKIHKLSDTVSAAKTEIVLRLESLQAGVIRQSDRFTSFMSGTAPQMESFREQLEKRLPSRLREDSSKKKSKKESKEKRNRHLSGYPNLTAAAKKQLASLEELYNEIKRILQDNDDERY